MFIPTLRSADAPPSPVDEALLRLLLGDGVTAGGVPAGDQPSLHPQGGNTFVVEIGPKWVERLGEMWIAFFDYSFAVC